MRTIYLDYNATTPLDDAVREAMLPFLGDNFGNPSSVHHVGQRARVALDDARERVCAVLGCRPSEIIFTSGATESCNLAIIGAAELSRENGRHIVTSAIEHPSVLRACEYLAINAGYELSVVSPDASGMVAPEAIFEAIRPDTILVSLMTANNEVGTLQPVAEVGEFCANNDILFHTDAVQAFGKLPFSNIGQFRADFVSLCAHKLYGPKGAGLLYARSSLLLPPLLHGGAHENEHRAGTENLPAIIGLAETVERFVVNPVFNDSSLLPLSSRIIDFLDSSDAAIFRGHRELRLSNTVAFSVPRFDSIALLSCLDLEGICASSGSACSSGSVSPSHVLSAMGVDELEANSLIRLSLGRESSSSEIDLLIASLSRFFEPTTL